VLKPIDPEASTNVASAAEIELESPSGDRLAAPPVQPDPQDDLPVIVIERQPGWRVVNFRELWRYRELLFFLTWRDIKVRYKQTVLGATWAILQPFATMVVFSLFFGRLASLPAGSAPYPLFVFAGLIPWFFFSNAITSGGQSVVGNQNLVTKVYFPRLIIPLGAVGATLVDFVISFVMLIALMFYYGVVPGWSLLLTPFIGLGLLLAATGVGTLLSALTVAYRDFRYVVPFMVQLWMFATPIIYLNTESFGSPRWEAVLPFNPAYGLIENFRASVLDMPLNLYSLSISAGMSLLLLVIGCLYFRRVERGFADII
jgi:lipopolysaccharide transport system permease protein